MRFRPLGTSGISASVVGLGTWAIGGWMWGGTDADQAVQAIQAAIDCGMNLIDTAPVYGFGVSEELVGRAIAGRRDRVVLASKCGLVWDVAAGQFFFASQPENIDDQGSLQVHRYLAPASIQKEVEASLRRLGTDYLDLYQTHWQDPTTPIASTMECLLRLKKQGKIRAIGVSNATVEQMETYRKSGAVDSDQERYSMIDRKLDGAHLAYLQRCGMAFLAYSPLEQGLLSGQVGPDRRFPPHDQRAASPRFSVDNRRRVAAMLREFEPIARNHDLDMSQLVIAWTIHQPGVSHALIGARTAAQVLANAGGGDVSLTAAEMRQMDRILAAHVPAIV